ncbi:MAG: hypothetical protein VKO39_06740 [Cyanobacteriota bacterium]|nr:hypothetical protein [Cyanobacteriota bacterium]
MTGKTITCIPPGLLPIRAAGASVDKRRPSPARVTAARAAGDSPDPPMQLGVVPHSPPLAGGVG